MSAGRTARDLAALARTGGNVDRERLVLALVDLCAQSADAVRKPKAQARLGSIFVALATDAEHRIRQKLAAKLATADWPPPLLINMLARDDIEIARPIIAASPILSEADLIRLLNQTTIDHRVEVARRPYVGRAVVDAILDQGEPEVMTALAGNDTADIQPEGMRRLVDASRHFAGLRSPLARHPRLTSEMAAQLYVWVGDMLRAAIVSRFRVDAESLDVAIAEAVRDAHTEFEGVTVDAPSPPDDEHRRMERRLVEKLHATRQLRVSYLLQALREHRLSLFEAALATLGEYGPEAVRLAVNADRPDLLALACVGIGMDRAVFVSLLALLRDLNAGRPGGDAAGARKAFEDFGPRHGKLARRAFEQATSTAAPA